MNVMDQRLPQWLAERLAQRLPGPMVGSRFEPHPRPWRHYDTAPPDARPGAVLLLLYSHDDRWWLPLTLRPAHLAAHAGQVSLPGGAVEPGETAAAAALREFHEELGDDGRPIKLLGTLSPLYVQASKYLVTPWVAAAASQPQFTANATEVEEVLEIPLVHLLDPDHFGSHDRQHEGSTYVAPHFLFGAHRIWGATCMILGEFVTILEDCRLLIEDG
jgi:8-oxo-dGTP pyrophosphatase MutT (NUDIX family)